MADEHHGALQLFNQDLLAADESSSMWSSNPSARTDFNRTWDNIHIAVARFGTRLNGLALIHLLPDEAILDMLNYTLSPHLSTTSIFEYHRTLRTLAQVCQRWRNVINSTAAFWTIIDGTKSPSLVIWSLHRSKQARLHVFFRHRKHASIRGDQRWDVLYRETHRWESAVIEWNHPAQAAFGDAPALKTLFLKSRPNSGAVIRIQNILKGCAPLLRDLELDGIEIVNWHPVFNNLRSLVLSNIPSSSIPIHSLLTIIHGARALEQLSLQNVSAEVDIDEMDEINEMNETPLPFHQLPINLPHLTEMTLSRLPSTFISQLLDSIQTPQCNRVTFEDNPSEAFELNAWTEYMKPNFQLSLATADSFHVCLEGYTTIHFETEGASTDHRPFYLTVVHHNRPIIFQEFIRIFSLKSIPPPLCLTLSRLEASRLPKVLVHLPNVRLLCAMNMLRTSITPFFNALHKQYPTLGGHHWILPQLESVNLHNCDLLPQDLLRLIRARQEAGSTLTTPDGGSRARRPEPVRDVTISGTTPMTDQVWEQIVARIGSESAFRDKPTTAGWEAGWGASDWSHW